jgi:hypothetical protein
MSRLLGILALLAILGAGVFIGLRETGVIEGGSVLGNGGSSTSSSVRGAGTSSSTTTTTATSTTTSKAGTATSASTSSTVAGATTTLPTASTTTTLPRGSVPDCGRGVARAVAGVTTVEGAYEVTATVRNEADRAVEVDTLVVRATYPGPRTATYPSDATKFAGTRIDPGEEVTFAMRESRGAEAPTSFEVAEFSYHTADLPQCKSS